MTLPFRFIRFVLAAGLSLFMAGLVVALAAYFYITPQLPPIERLKDVQLQVPLRIYANDGELIRLNIPPLTEERRKDLVKQIKNEAEHGRVSIRNVRKEANDNLRKLLKEHVSEDDVHKAEAEIQSLTDEYIQKIEEATAKKEDEIMTV